MNEDLKVIITDCDHDSIQIEKDVLEKAGIPLELKQCKTEEDVIRECQDADVFIVQYAPITRKVMEACPKLKYVVRYGVGVDTVDVPAATELGVQVGNVPDYGMNEVADHTIAMSLAMLRKIVPMNEQTKTKKWDYTTAIPVHRFSDLTCGVVGLGRIGRNFAQKMHALSFKVIGFDPYFRETNETAVYVTPVPFDELVKESDIISLHCPADGNKDLFNEKTFRDMKDSALIVNVARGDHQRGGPAGGAEVRHDRRGSPGLHAGGTGESGQCAIPAGERHCDSSHGVVFRGSSQRAEAEGGGRIRDVPGRKAHPLSGQQTRKTEKLKES